MLLSTAIEIWGRNRPEMDASQLDLITYLSDTVRESQLAHVDLSTMTKDQAREIMALFQGEERTAVSGTLNEVRKAWIAGELEPVSADPPLDGPGAEPEVAARESLAVYNDLSDGEDSANNVPETRAPAATTTSPTWLRPAVGAAAIAGLVVVGVSIFGGSDDALQERIAAGNADVQTENVQEELTNEGALRGTANSQQALSNAGASGDLGALNQVLAAAVASGDSQALQQALASAVASGDHALIQEFIESAAASGNAGLIQEALANSSGSDNALAGGASGGDQQTVFPIAPFGSPVFDPNFGLYQEIINDFQSSASVYYTVNGADRDEMVAWYVDYFPQEGFEVIGVNDAGESKVIAIAKVDDPSVTGLVQIGPVTPNSLELAVNQQLQTFNSSAVSEPNADAEVDTVGETQLDAAATDEASD